MKQTKIKHKLMFFHFFSCFSCVSWAKIEIMPIQRPFNFKIILIVICFLISSYANAQVNKSVKNSDSEKNTNSSYFDKILKKQILLTNKAEFSKNRTLKGASSFLLTYQGNTFAITARHLLGEAGGIEPEIGVNDLKKSLVKWEMIPRVVDNKEEETIKVTADGVDFSQSSADILLLKVISSDYKIKPLKPNFELPSLGEKLFLIGCPYSEVKCRQNSYEVIFDGVYEVDGSLICEIKSSVELAGFSGAPLVNGKGEVLGVLVSSGEENGKNYVIATHIKEIQKINY